MRRIPSLIYAVVLLLILSTACDSPMGIRSNSASGNKSLLASKGGGGGGEIEVAGNNLSFPVIWADGVTKALRGTYLTEVFEGESFTKNDTLWYVQADLQNTWQAESYDPTTADNPEKVVVSTIDWGDNLEAKSWSTNSQIRVETVLYKILTGEPMTAYRMMQYDETVSGLDEIWGTNGIKYSSNEATIYSGTARLIIQKLTKPRDNATLSLTWNPATSQWDGDAYEPLISSGVWSNISGPTAYSAEINVQGKLIYGYNWVTKRDADGVGDYRITFVLEPSAPGVTCNTAFDASTKILVSEEETETEVAAEEEPLPSGGVAEIDVTNNLTYIDVRLTGSTGGGKKGGGQGSGGHKGGKSDLEGSGRHM